MYDDNTDSGSHMSGPEEPKKERLEIGHEPARMSESNNGNSQNYRWPESRSQERESAESGSFYEQPRQVGGNLANESGDRAQDEVANDESSSFDIKQEIGGDNSGNVIGVLNQTVRRMLDSHKLSDNFVTESMEVYVEHPGVGECLSKLQKNRVAVLVGDEGIGRHTAAIWLLNKLHDVRLREVRREPNEPFNVNDILGERKVGWILDLRSEDAQVSVDLGRSLADDGARDDLKQAESFLIVVARSDLWKKVGNGGRELEFILQRPSQEKILNRHLRAGIKPLKEQHSALWSQNPNIIKELSKLTPLEVVEWSADIRNEHSVVFEQDPNYREIPKENIDNAVEARTNWFDDLLNWFKKNQSSERRNFILAAAVLEGCRAGDVYIESQNIATCLGENEEDRAAGQQGPGIHELVSDSNAVLENGDYLNFSKSGYARSVIEYFWVDRMHLRSKFIEWLVDTSKKKGGDYDSATFERMGDYILRWCSQRREIDDLEEVIYAWSSNEELRQSAQDLLSAAAFDPVLGKRVREKMLTWAKSENLDDVDVQAVVADACGGPLGAVFEKVMLYRLGFLAKSPDAKVQEAAGNAFDLLWNAEYTRPRIREAITRWLTGGDESRREAGLSSFVAIASVTNGFRESLCSQDAQGEIRSSALLHEDEQNFFVAGWRSALEVNRADPRIEFAFSSWMENALISDIYEDMCVEIVEQSVYPSSSGGQISGTRSAILARLLYVWAPAGADDGRAKVRDRVITRVWELDPIRQLDAPSGHYKSND